ncbi:MAG TPA: TRAP transporter TatT component family protein [Polyangiaceae bacterium]|jgi:hypothetical protein
MRTSSFALPLSILAALALTNAGCIKSMLTDGQISATREASGVFDTIGDYELARGAAESGLVQFEGMHRLSPSNTDALYSLAQAWTGYGFAFAEDDMEAAQDKGNDDLTEYHKRRAHMAYDRAVFYGLELLSHRDKGFDAARKNANTMKAWLKENFTSQDDAGNLFWTGYGWMARTNIDKDDPAVVADLFVGESMVERAVELDPSFNHYTGELALAAYQVAVQNVTEGKRLFELVLQKTQRKDMMVQFTYAQTYACQMNDRALYESLMNEVINSGDTDPEQRLENAIAKRRARRYLGKDRMSNCGFDMSTHSPAPAPQAAATPAAAAPAAPAPAAAAKKK